MDLNDRSILHYASEFYNPAKAHEYYLRTRKLKGRHSTKGFSKKKTEAWAYARNQIGEKQKSQTQQVRNEKTQQLERVRAQASALRRELSEKLKVVNDSLTEKPNAQAERARIASELKAVISSYEETYKQRLAAIKAEATANLDREYKNIKKKVR